MCKYIDELKRNDYKKNSIKSIASKYNLSTAELKRYYQTKFFSNISKSISLDSLSKINIDAIEKSLYIAMTNGFTTNINQIESGVMVSNAGDSAEFIFVARAILAGFNCSSVDVRSSRYDAIIDCNDKLLRVQINSISFKDRDRGGQGIDHTHKRNIGQRITSKDCDIYVAVDKQVGLCYVIPMSWADALADDECKSVNLSKVSEYRENWDLIKEMTIK